jgi:type II secretory pathway component PulK
MMRGRGSRESESGFALLAAIWFVVVLALVAVVIAGWMQRSLGLAQRLQERLAAHRATIGAENEVAFRMVTGFFSTRGLELPQGEELTGAMAPESALGFAFATQTRYAALDDRPYKLGSVVVRLQDESGLYTLNYPGPVLLGNLLRSYGIGHDDRGVLFDRLLDYMDKSDLYRLNGATAADYLSAGRPPPRNAPLLTPWEALRVLSWNAYPALWRGPDALPDLTTISDTVQLNPNTAPAGILRSLPGMDDAAVERIIKYRARYIIQSPIDLDRAAGVDIPVDLMQFLFFPSGNLRVTILSAKDPLVHRLALRRTPIGEAPYRVDYAVDLPADDEARDLTRAGDLPALPEPGQPDSPAVGNN